MAYHEKGIIKSVLPTRFHCFHFFSHYTHCWVYVFIMLQHALTRRCMLQCCQKHDIVFWSAYACVCLSVYVRICCILWINLQFNAIFQYKWANICYHKINLYTTKRIVYSFTCFIKWKTFGVQTKTSECR